MQPGSHSGAGIYKEKLVLCLPGNPAACLVAYELLAAEIMRKIQGLNFSSPRIMATCTNSYNGSQLEIPRYLRGKADLSDKGWLVEILPAQKSSMIRSLINCNALIELLAGQSEIKAGSKLNIIVLGNSSIQGF